METPSLITDPAAMSSWQRANRTAQNKYHRVEAISEIGSVIGDFRLDWREAIEFAIKLNDLYDPSIHGGMTFRDIARQENMDGWSRIHMASVGEKAWAILRAGDKL
jgi:hypothetical protein